MNRPSPNSKTAPSSRASARLTQAEDTLRLVAKLPPPDGLEHRVHLTLIEERAREAMGAHQRSQSWISRFQILRVPSSRFTSRLLPIRMQWAAATVLFLAGAGATWSLMHGAHPSSTANPVAPLVSPSAGTGGFGAAKGASQPKTLKPIKVPPVPHKKLKAPGKPAIAAPTQAEKPASQP